MIIAVARAGLVANSVPFGIPAAAHRSGSSVQDAGRYKGPVDQRVPGRRGVGQIDRDLGVLDPPGGAGVLALHTHRVDSLLEVSGLVNHQDGVRVAEVVDDVAAEVVADQVGVPDRAGQQVLQRIRCLRAAVLGDGPAVLPVQIGQQPEHQRGGVPAWFVPGEPATDPVQQVTEPGPPSVRVYAMRRGHRGVFFVPHKHGMIARWPP